MIITTTPTIEGHNIVEYKGIAFGEVIVADMLPAMVFIMPISWGWVHWILPLISH